MLRGKERRPLACFHEGGHCLARWYFGFGIDRVRVLTCEEAKAGVELIDRRGRVIVCEGLVEAHDIGTSILTRSQVVEGVQEELIRLIDISNEIALIECCAGIDAEARYTKQSSVGRMFMGGMRDIQRFRQILDCWWPDPAEQRRVSLRAEDRSRALLCSSQGWRAVTDIAEALMDCGDLDGRAVSEICRAAYGGRQPQHGSWNDYWPPSLKQIRAGFIPE